jgi:hypothetical protein
VNAVTAQSLLYVDGVQKAALGSAVATTSGGTATRLGRQYDPAAEYFGGNLFDVQVYTGALTAAQAAQIAANTPASASALPPAITSLSPTSAAAGGAAFTLTVNGSAFLTGSNVLWNGSAVATSYVSANQLNATIPAGLIASPGAASVTVVNSASSTSTAATFTVFSPGSNVQTISHIADGGGWRSTIILVNTDTVPALYAVNFRTDAGASYTPPLQLGSAAGTIPVGGSVIIETADTASAVSEGWAQVTSNQSIGGTAIFSYDPWSQEAAVPLLTSGGVKLQIPYQVGNGLALGIALANPSATQTANITEIIRDQSGKQLASRTLTLAALNHSAFNPTFPSTIAVGGVVEYDSNVNIYALGIRSSPEGTGLAFTSLDAVLPLAASAATISHIADGGGWRSTIILVNTDTVPASYTVSFRNDSGAPYAPSLALGAATGTIPVGGSTILATADTASALSEGWAQVTSSQSIGGTAIFRYDPWSQEAAVPLLTSGGSALGIPYQVGNGLSLGVALANPSATQAASITEVIRDQSGNQVASRTFTLAALSHTAFNPVFPNGITGGGVVTYASNVNIFALGIRSAPEGAGLAFTSVRAAYLPNTGAQAPPAAAGGIQAFIGSQQGAIVNQAFASSLVALVLDGKLNPVSGAPVTWAVSSGKAQLAGLSATTDTNGQSSMAVTAGNTPGTVTVTATTGSQTAQFSLIVAVAPTTAPSINSVSTTSPAPLTPLSIATVGINPALAVTVNFFNSSGYSASEQAVEVDGDGTVIAGVPIYASTAGVTSSGTVSVTIGQGGLTSAPISVTIQDLPSQAAFGTSIGQMSHAFLNYEALMLAQAINELQAFHGLPGNTVNVASSVASLQTLLTAVLGARNDVDAVSANNSLVIQEGTTADGTVIRFDQTSVDMMDRILGVYVSQMLPYLSSSSNSSLPTANSLLLAPRASATLSSIYTLLKGFGKADNPLALADSLWVSTDKSAVTRYAVAAGAVTGAFGFKQASAYWGFLVAFRGVITDAAEIAAETSYLNNERSKINPSATAIVTVDEQRYESEIKLGVDLFMLGSNAVTLVTGIEVPLNSALSAANTIRDWFKNGTLSQIEATTGALLTEAENGTIFPNQLSSVNGEVASPSVLASEGVTGITVQSGLPDSFTGLSDPGGDYDITVPVGDPNFNYGNAQVGASDPVTGKPLGSASVNLNNLNPQTPQTVATVPISGTGPVAEVWTGTYNFTATNKGTCTVPGGSGQLTMKITDNGDGSFGGSVSVTNLQIYNGACQLVKTESDTSGMGSISGKISSGPGGAVLSGQILDIFNDLTGAVWSFTATVSEATMSGTINQGTGTFNVSR